jgi:hypothetical protein
MSTVNTDSVSGALGSLSPLTSTFSSSFAQPLKAALPKTYSPGYSGRFFHENDNFLSLRSPLKSVHLRSPRAFFNSILINGDKQLKDCSAKPFKSIDGSPCAYMDVSLALSDSNISAFNNRILTQIVLYELTALSFAESLVLHGNRNYCADCYCDLLLRILLCSQWW